jgi:hypothetical protein
MPSVPVLLTDLMASIIQRRYVMRGVVSTDRSNDAARLDSNVWLLCAVSYCALPAPDTMAGTAC